MLEKIKQVIKKYKMSSLPRAYVNCKRCYALAEIAHDEIVARHGEDVSEKTERDELFQNDQLYNARNESMKALEETLEKANSMVEKFEEQYTKKQIEESKVLNKIYEDSIVKSVKFAHALISCAGCDYSQPKIANSMKNHVFE